MLPRKYLNTSYYWWSAYYCCWWWWRLWGRRDLENRLLTAVGCKRLSILELFFVVIIELTTQVSVYLLLLVVVLVVILLVVVVVSVGAAEAAIRNLEARLVVAVIGKQT